MTTWFWTVHGTADTHASSPRPLICNGAVQADNGEEALHRLLAEMPGPWDELLTDEEFTITIRPGDED